MSAPGPLPGARGLARLLDGGVDDLAVARSDRMTRHLPHAFLVAEAITDLKQHRQDLEGLGRHERESSTRHSEPQASGQGFALRFPYVDGHFYSVTLSPFFPF